MLLWKNQEMHREIWLDDLRGKRSYERPRCRWEGNIKIDLREVGCYTGDYMDLAQDVVNYGNM